MHSDFLMQPSIKGDAIAHICADFLQMPALCQTEWESDTISAWNQCGKVRTSGSWRHASKTQMRRVFLTARGTEGVLNGHKMTKGRLQPITVRYENQSISGVSTERARSICAPRLQKGKCFFKKCFHRFR